MAINERVITGTQEAAAAGSGNQEEGLILHLDANDVDSYDGDGTEWVDITNHEYKPATNVSEHFNTVLFTGDGTTDREITGVGFQPDLVWTKSRGVTGSHTLFDSVRGAAKHLFSNADAAEATYTPTEGVTSFNGDGFDITNGNQNLNNYNGRTYVAWCFKAGGTAVSNTDGDITSQVSVNDDLGFSIVKYEATGVSGDTFGHGLGVKPDMAIVKETSASGNNWHVYVNGITSDAKDLRLNSTNGLTSVSSSRFIHADIDSSVIALGNSGGTNTNNSDYIAYCFASKRGVSKVGSYTGTGAAGNKVYTGFEPAWIIIKRTNGTQDWWIVDNKTSTSSGEFNKYLEANTTITTATPGTNINIHRDGFSFDGVSFNNSGDSFIYLAFAKDTNETDLYDTDLELHLDAGDDTTVSTSTWSDKANSNDGTFSGFSSTLTDFYEKELGNYIQFDGTDDKITTTYDATTTNGVTVEVWFKQEGSGTVRALFGDDTKFVCFIGGQITGSFTDESIYFYKDGAIGTRGAMVLRLGEDYFDGKGWQHLAIVDVPSAKNKMYLNGEEVSYSSISGYLDTFSFDFNNFKISNGYSGSYFFKGGIGQLRVYEDALSQDQIRQNFNFTKNDYPNGFNGTISGATWNSSGYFDFDGSNDYVKIDPLPITNYICSHSFWMKTTDSSTYYVTSFRNPIYFGFGLGITTAGKYTFAMYDGTNAYNLEMSTADSNIIKDGNWHHIVLTNGNSVGKIYLDGVYNSQIATSTTQFSYGSVNAIGQRADLINSSPYDGFISKFKVYDKELTQAEITALYNEGE